MSLVNLRDQISEVFSAEELDSLCFDLGIDKDNLEGDSKLAKSRELVAYCQRHERLQDLRFQCQNLRPSLDWGLGQVNGDQMSLVKQPALGINLDTWLPRAYRIPNLIDRLLLNQPFELRPKSWTQKPGLLNNIRGGLLGQPVGLELSGRQIA